MNRHRKHNRTATKAYPHFATFVFLHLIPHMMKKVIFTILLLISFLNSNAQFTANAGIDIHSCDMDTNANSVSIGGVPTASNGIPPYTYEWSIVSIELGFPGSGLFFHASNILNDSTISNPVIIERNVASTVVLFLKITDATGFTAYDTCKVSFSNFMEHLMWYSWVINSGDSAFIDVGSNVGGGVGSLTYLWQPSNSLNDSTIESDFWAKPFNSTNYYVTVTDSMGCQRTGAPFCFVNVNPLSVDGIESNTFFNVFPNPVNNLLSINYSSTADSKIEIINSQGQIIKELSNQKTTGNYTITVDTKQFTKGIYFIKISGGGNTKQTRIIIY